MGLRRCSRVKDSWRPDPIAEEALLSRRSTTVWLRVAVIPQVAPVLVRPAGCLRSLLRERRSQTPRKFRSPVVLFHAGWYQVR